MGDFDCGDNSCVFATKKGGMRTNGGCACLESVRDSVERMEITTAVRALQDRLARAEKAGKQLSECAKLFGEVKARYPEKFPDPRVVDMVDALLECATAYDAARTDGGAGVK